MKLAKLLPVVCLLGSACIEGAPAEGAPARALSKVWVADNGDGTYRNPVLHADYSDPDVVRVGSDYYMVSSSFTCAPGLPVLHSRDLVNWELLTYIYAAQPPLQAFRVPRHGGGSWAPAIRHHNGEFYVYYPDPDFGIYVTKAKNAAGPWTEPKLVKAAKGWIDPCPLWDEDGQAYLVSAFARSRSGLYSTLIVSRMSADGTKLLDDGVLVFDGHEKHPTVEGPKFYKRGGYYYIFAPAGGVATGWQLVLRAKNIYGPYEEKIVLAQGATEINGPHQGGWVDTPSGENWFVHFQDKGPYGRVVHLQPMRWEAGWPVMGENGAPVLRHAKPKVAGPVERMTPPDSDEFNSPRLGLQWQWESNPEGVWALPSSALGVLRLYCVRQTAACRNLYDQGNVLLQKFPAPAFTATAKLDFIARGRGDRAGLVVFGNDYAALSLRKAGERFELVYSTCAGAERGAAESVAARADLNGGRVYLRVKVGAAAECRFSYSEDGVNYREIGPPFTAKKGAWIGAKVGLFAGTSEAEPELGYVDADWFRVEPNQ